MRQPDEPLRRRALDELGPLGEALAREALEHAEIFLEPDVLAWEGSSGTMHAHRAILALDAELRDRVLASHAALGALVSALAAALAQAPGQSLAEVRLEPGAPAATSTPYR